MDPMTAYAIGAGAQGLGGIIGGSGSSSTFVEKAQRPFLDFTRNLAQQLTQQGGGAGFWSQQAGQDLYGLGMQNLGQLTDNPFLQSLQAQAGGNPALVNQQIGQLQADLGRSFQQEVLPGIRRDATAIGALGGSRQGVAEGIAGQGFADAFSRGVTDIFSADAQRALQAGTAGGGLLAQGALGGLSQLGNLFTTGLGQFTGGFAPLMLGNQVIGPPNVLQKSSSGSGLSGLF